MAELAQTLAPLLKRFLEAIDQAETATNSAQHGKFHASSLEELARRVEGIAAQMRAGMNALKEAHSDLDAVRRA